LLDDIDLIDVDRSVLQRAARIERPIRALDAIHLATAELLGESLGALVTYDSRMADAARQMGLIVQTPITVADATAFDRSESLRTGDALTDPGSAT
jgi:predicted nucleic acid-binding protein